MKTKYKITIIGITITVFLLYFIPTTEFFEITSYENKSPSPMMILGNSDNEVIRGFKITPISCNKTDTGLNESHFQITNTHEQDYDVKIGVLFTDNDSILYEKEILVSVLAGQTISQTHLSDEAYDNPVCVVQINAWHET